MVNEHTTSLEAVGSVCVLGAVALLTLTTAGRATSTVPLLVAGALLDLSAGTKIWDVGVVVVVVLWASRQLGVRRAAQVWAGVRHQRSILLVQPLGEPNLDAGRPIAQRASRPVTHEDPDPPVSPAVERVDRHAVICDRWFPCCSQASVEAEPEARIRASAFIRMVFQE